MPDERPQSSTVQIVSLVINCIQTIVIAWLSIQANVQHAEVKATQDEATQTAKEVKTALNARADKIDKATAEQKEAAIPAAFGNWKWLENVASLNPTKENLDAADNAKRVYEDLAKKKN